jgi:hypothetical protein
MKDFVKRAEKNSKESINRAYRDIDFIYYEIDFLNNLLNRYSNKTSGRTLSVYERQDEMARIRERIANAYKDINFYKECINVERKEMKRIYDTYGFEPSYQVKYETYNKVDDYNEFRAQYEDDGGDFEEKYDEEEEEIPVEEELEEIKEYKYNFVTDTWE